MIWILVYFLASAIVAPLLGYALSAAGDIAEGKEMVGEVERYPSNIVTDVNVED